MRPMDYISSKNLCFFLCDVLRLADRRPVDHGFRVSYLLYKMLETKGGYDEYEMAELAFLAMLHDLGAYKTEDLNDAVRYENKEFQAHSIYGYLFLKHLTPMEQRSRVLLYHHMDYSQIKNMTYEYGNIIAYLQLLERVDALFMALGDAFDHRMLQKHAGSSYSPEGLVLLARLIEKEKVLEKLKSGQYMQELDGFMENVLFTNEEKRRYMEMTMYCVGLMQEYRTTDIITCVCIADALAGQMKLPEVDWSRLYYAILIHDIGMLSVPRRILEAPRSLNGMEKERVRSHIATEEKLFRKYFKDTTLVDIALTHHERGDGSGYPQGLKENQMSLSQKILQLADMVTALMHNRSYRMPKKKEEIIAILHQEMEKGRLNRKITECFVNTYDTTMEKVRAESRQYLLTHMRINTQYKLVRKNMSGEK